MQRGFTLLEMLVVMFILGVIASVVLPEFSSRNSYKLEIASRELVNAIRFAREESIRTGNPHGIILSSSNETAKVYELISGTATYNIYHPIDKKLYTLDLRTDSATSGVDLQSYNIFYQGIAGSKSYIGFNEYGNPKYFDSGTDHMLNGTATITLSSAGQTRTINVSSMTGRVTVL